MKILFQVELSPEFFSSIEASNWLTYCIIFGAYRVSKHRKKIAAIYCKAASGTEPVRDWLRSLSKEDRLKIGTDILTVEFGWPVGMPACRAMGGGLFEVRTNLAPNRIARTLFFIEEGHMYLLRGFIKKTQKTPKPDLDLARQRKRDLEI